VGGKRDHPSCLRPSSADAPRAREHYVGLAMPTAVSPITLPFLDAWKTSLTRISPSSLAHANLSFSREELVRARTALAPETLDDRSPAQRLVQPRGEVADLRRLKHRPAIFFN